MPSPHDAERHQSPSPTQAAAATPCPRGLFTAVEGVAIDARTDPALIRQRAVRVDFSQLDADPDRLALNLFDNICLTAIRHPAAAPQPGVWTGTIDGVPNSTVMLVTSNRTVIGTVVSPPRTFQIRLLRDDIHLVNDVDPSKYPKEK